MTQVLAAHICCCLLCLLAAIQLCCCHSPLYLVSAEGCFVTAFPDTRNVALALQMTDTSLTTHTNTAMQMLFELLTACTCQCTVYKMTHCTPFMHGPAADTDFCLYQCMHQTCKLLAHRHVPDVVQGHDVAWLDNTPFEADAARLHVPGVIKQQQRPHRGRWRCWCWLFIHLLLCARWQAQAGAVMGSAGRSAGTSAGSDVCTDATERCAELTISCDGT